MIRRTEQLFKPVLVWNGDGQQSVSWLVCAVFSGEWKLPNIDTWILLSVLIERRGNPSLRAGCGVMRPFEPARGLSILDFCALLP